jgi:hypothetical protein
LESIFTADPQKAHRVFVDRLLAPRADSHAHTAFSVWTDWGHERWWPPYSSAEILRLENWFEPEWWSQWIFGYLERHIQRENHAKCRLPDAELLRLATATDPNVRAFINDSFRYRLTEEWRDCFQHEVQERVRLRPKP